MLGHAVVPAGARPQARHPLAPNPLRFLQFFPAATQDQIDGRVFPRALIVACVAFVKIAIIG